MIDSAVRGNAATEATDMPFKAGVFGQSEGGSRHSVVVYGAAKDCAVSQTE